MNQWKLGDGGSQLAYEQIARQRYGVICVGEGMVQHVRFRRWPRWASWCEVLWWEQWRRFAALRDECRLYYSQPRQHSQYLTINYIASNAGTSLATLRRTMTAMDQIAVVKRADAILCQISSRRISDRLLQRWGWQRHLLQSRQRHWIKRFYGAYESVDRDLTELLAAVGEKRK